MATIFLFVSPTWTFDRLSTELLDVLRERYGTKGIPVFKIDNRITKTTKVPAEGGTDVVQVAYGMLKDPDDACADFKTDEQDAQYGWQILDTDEGQKLLRDVEIEEYGEGGQRRIRRGFNDMDIVAFTLLDPEIDVEGDAQFEVIWPKLMP